MNKLSAVARLFTFSMAVLNPACKVSPPQDLRIPMSVQTVIQWETLSENSNVALLSPACNS